MGLWKKIEISTLEDPPALLEPDDICFFAREYVSGGSYKTSEANQLISNLKKDPSKRNSQYEWAYKVKAVKQFAKELSAALPPKASFALIPTSKVNGDPQRDPRWDMLKAELTIIRPDLLYKRPIVRTVSCPAVHEGARRKMREIRASFGWEGFQNVPSTLALVDDVITAGAHFKVCQAMIREHHPTLPVIGVFWAKVKWDKPEPCE